MFRKKTKTLPTSPVEYPSGSCVKTEKGYFYIKGTKRYRIPSRRILDSWNFQRVIETTEAAVVYRIAGKIGFRDGSLIYNIADGKIYLVSDNLRRHVTSPDALDRIGATMADVVTVSDDDIKIQKLGEELK